LHRGVNYQTGERGEGITGDIGDGGTKGGSSLEWRFLVCSLISLSLSLSLSLCRLSLLAFFAETLDRRKKSTENTYA
jgi:hypothetical protein